ncbi:glycosyltransferase family 1 protein [Lachnotalea glycerini]|uniref:Glycosyltransferase family 1 protein n=1 Tax=Lachnotalea glycerini TaxID=1763509 RepID=A0A371JGB3_9FIRM|nr:glycosyltransferase family 1 protein [Lachnotalea glycerini]RDY31716.1 glycosyltransferase family 1 protein [Lachnotalea glycerini]
MKKKFIYITFLNEDIRPGYKIKIHSQCKGVSQLGLKSYLFIVKEYGMALYEIGEDEVKIKEYRMNRPRKKQDRNISDEFYLFRFFIQKVKEAIQEINPDVVYIRRIVPITPMLISFIKWIRNQDVKVIYEYPTFPWREEMKRNKQYLFYILDVLFYKSLIDKLDAIAYIGNYEGKKDKYVKINNGVDVSGFKLHQKRNIDDIGLIAVAHVGFYHGYDRVIEGLKLYYDTKPMRKVIFHIVGPIDKRLGLEKMVNERGLNDVVIFYGYREMEDIDKIFEVSDIGIDCLGLFRRDINSASSLKSREYLARGIPYLTCGETDFDAHNLDFIFYEEAVEKSVDIGRLVKGYDNMKSTEEDIRTFAINNLSWTEQMKTVLKSIERGK